MISLLKKRLQEQSLSAVELYSKTLKIIDSKSDYNAFISVNKQGINDAIQSQEKINMGCTFFPRI